MKMKTFTILMLLLIAGVVFAGCMNTKNQVNPDSQNPATQAPVKDRMLKFGELWLITGYDPANNGVFITEKAIVTESLVGATQDFKLVPTLATSWSQTSPKTWVFTLRDNVKFHNGQPMTAKEVKFSLDRAAKLNAQNREFMDYNTSRVIDDHTIEITTSQTLRQRTQPQQSCGA